MTFFFIIFFSGLKLKHDTPFPISLIMISGVAYSSYDDVIGNNSEMWVAICQTTSYYSPKYYNVHIIILKYLYFKNINIGPAFNTYMKTIW
jgi:hypothetical protein